MHVLYPPEVDDDGTVEHRKAPNARKGKVSTLVALAMSAGKRGEVNR